MSNEYALTLGRALALRGAAPHVSGDEIEFELAPHRPCSARLLGGSLLEMSAQLGIASVQKQRRLFEHDDWPDDPWRFEPAINWTEETAAWSFQVRIADAVAVLARRAAACESVEDCIAALDRFHLECERWRAWLLREDETSADTIALGCNVLRI